MGRVFLRARAANTPARPPPRALSRHSLPGTAAGSPGGAGGRPCTSLGRAGARHCERGLPRRPGPARALRRAAPRRERCIEIHFPISRLTLKLALLSAPAQRRGARAQEISGRRTFAAHFCARAPPAPPCVPCRARCPDIHFLEPRQARLVVLADVPAQVWGVPARVTASACRRRILGLRARCSSPRPALRAL